MLLVAGNLILDDPGLAELRAINAAHTAATEAEEGCISFSLGVSDERTGNVCVLEMWRDQEALLDHHRQPHTKLFLDRVGPHIKEMNVHLYPSDGPKPLPMIERLEHLKA